MSTSMSKPLDVRLDRVKEIAVRAGLDPKLAVKRPDNLEVIHAARKHIGGDEDTERHTEALWRACSGAAHGDAWAGLSLHDKEVRSRDGHVATLEMTASTRQFVTITSETFVVINSAHNLFDLRNRSPY